MKLRSGFTFLEIIIVITIVAIMAVMAVYSFGLARQKAKVDLLADNLVSLIQQQQALSKSGKTNACFGIEFHASKKGVESVQLLTLPYTKVDGIRADFCDNTKAERVPFSDMENFTLLSLDQQQSPEDTSSNSVSDFVLLFKPPFGRLEVGESVDNVVSPGSVDPFLKVTIADEKGKEQRSFIFDMTTLMVQKIKSNEPT